MESLEEYVKEDKKSDQYQNYKSALALIAENRDLQIIIDNKILTEINKGLDKANGTEFLVELSKIYRNLRG